MAGPTGLVVPPRDPEALRAALRGLARDTAQLERLSAASRIAAETYTWERCIASYERVMLDAVCSRYARLHGLPMLPELDEPERLRAINTPDADPRSVLPALTLSPLPTPRQAVTDPKCRSIVAGDPLRRNPLHPRRRQSRMRAEYSAAAGGVILVARFAAGAVLNYAFGIALAWLMVPSEFGTVSAVQNVLLLAAGLLIAGPPWALAMRIAQTHGDPKATEPEFRTALIANLAFGLLLGAAFLAAQLSGHQLVPTHQVRWSSSWRRRCR